MELVVTNIKTLFSDLAYIIYVYYGVVKDNQYKAVSKL